MPKITIKAIRTVAIETGNGSIELLEGEVKTVNFSNDFWKDIALSSGTVELVAQVAKAPVVKAPVVEAPEVKKPEVKK